VSAVATVLVLSTLSAAVKVAASSVSLPV